MLVKFFVHQHLKCGLGLVSGISDSMVYCMVRIRRSTDLSKSSLEVIQRFSQLRLMLDFRVSQNVLKLAIQKLQVGSVMDLVIVRSRSVSMDMWSVPAGQSSGWTAHDVSRLLELAVCQMLLGCVQLPEEACRVGTLGGRAMVIL